VNIGEPWPDLDEAELRVHAMQTKLHQWAISDPDRCFDDLYNLVYDPAFLVVAWSRVRDNKGGRSAGVDGVVPRSIVFSAGEFLTGLVDELKSRRFTPTSVREKMIPKANGKLRRLGIPTAADRTVQGSLKLVLEPIFEADFKPCSYGFRPKRRAQDAIAEIHYLGANPRNYEWVFEADIKACFDEIDHSALMGRVRRRIGDKRILGLVKAFLKSGILAEDGMDRATITGTPQGGILSPLLANIALSVLDEYFTQKWEALGPAWTRAKRRRQGVPTYRLVRYADDCATRTQGEIDVEGRTRQVVLCQRWWLAHRDRPAGGGPKPPQAAAVKSRGGKRCGKGGLEPVRYEPRRRAEANHSMTGRKRSDGIKSGVESLPRYESGGNLSTAQAVSGLKVARARFRLWHGTCEPATRYRPAVHWTCGPSAGESETPKWKKPRGAE
jgi:group II intron reverse transcriptase/maturase